MSTQLDLARRLLALSQTGLHFSQDEFDRERYREIAQIAATLLAQDPARKPQSADAQHLHDAWFVEEGYATPKIDVRGAIFRDARVLLVQERDDGRWTLPGGWADVNDLPSHAVEKEIEQESGFTARAVKLAAVLDRRRHDHPQFFFHVWKMFFICEITGGAPRGSYETTAVEFFPVNALPELSVGRVTQAQIERAYAHHLNQALPTDFD